MDLNLLWQLWLYHYSVNFYDMLVCDSVYKVIFSHHDMCIFKIKWAQDASKC